MKRRIFAFFVLLMTLCTLSQAQQLAVKRHSFQGKFLKSSITVSIWFEETEEGDLSGEIVYTSSKHKTPIRIFGTILEDSGKSTYHLFEYQANGKESGYFDIEKSQAANTYTGTWTADRYSEDPRRTYKMQLSPAPFPEGKGGTFTYSADPAGKYTYGFTHYAKGDLGGTVEIGLLRGNPEKMHVEISKYDPNIAEYDGHLMYDKGCMEGYLEDCDYKFRVQVFEDFVLVKTISGDGGWCFGAWTTLDGFYLKRK